MAAMTVLMTNSCLTRIAYSNAASLTGVERDLGLELWTMRRYCG